MSDAERQAVIDLLRRHVGDGRLTLVEFESRVDDVMAARTGKELRAVLRDLPPLPDPEAARRARARRRSAEFAWFAPLLMMLGVLAFISLAIGHVVIWPLFIFVFFRFGHRRRRHLRAA